LIICLILFNRLIMIVKMLNCFTILFWCNVINTTQRVWVLIVVHTRYFLVFVNQTTQTFDIPALFVLDVEHICILIYISWIWIVRVLLVLKLKMIVPNIVNRSMWPAGDWSDRVIRISMYWTVAILLFLIVVFRVIV